KAAHGHYFDGLGYFKAIDPFTIERFGAPKTRFLTVVLHYHTDKNGTLPNPSNPTGEFKLWQVPAGKYRQLGQIHAEFSLAEHGMRAFCTDSGFQKMTFSVCKGDPLWRSNQDLGGMTKEAADVLTRNDLARELTIDQIKEKLGEDISPAI